MKPVRTLLGLAGTIMLAGSLLIGCSSTPQSQDSTTSSPAQPSPAPAEDSSSTATTRPYTDYMGHESTIPVSPQRVIFSGETFGDLLVLGIKPVGGYGYTNHVYEDQLQGVENVGFPINLEKVLELSPDLILNANTDEKRYEQLSKIAPTVIFDTFAPLEDRMMQLGELFGKKEEASKWLASYKQKSDDTWKKLKESGMKEGETATVLTYYPRDRLFVMATTGLSQILYDPNGFKPTPLVQEVLDAQKGFELISLEKLPEIAGDRIFILNPVDEEPKKSTEALLQSRIWKELPAVKNGKVYFIDIEKANSDATTREWLLEKLPTLLDKK